ncbi:MAG: glycosyltransferase [Sphingobacteriales bacterium]|jgi:glycosyltransferase involved in cell wall biosynthesis|nr:glycosyltransferase [Sphingobacteriales bacterium]MBP9140461.1 glycosyltransferase [Chitinophagales bacterium]MDA0197439.1 glycosyltransferase [Bacteroidota bacterium]MBK6891278.1 glycosyltransferase [Sphingobacteriales bacterium]MBK7526892.1 glycosyltransferase [Sphingobacteriales bacterium]
MRIAYLSYDGMTDPLGQSQVLPYLCGLSERGYNFTLFSFEKTAKFAQNEQQIARICQQNHINWQRQTYTKKPPIVSTLYDVYRMYRALMRQHKQQPFELVHCRSYIAALVALRFKRKTNLPFIFDMRGFWADERVDGGIWNTKNWLYKQIYNYFKNRELEFVTQSAAVVSLTQAAKTEILSWKGVPANTIIEVIPCSVDMTHFSRADIDTAAIKQVQTEVWGKQQQLQKSGKILLYVGSIGTWYCLPEILAFYAQLLHQKKHIEPWKMVFLTPDPPEIIYNEAKRQNIDAQNIFVKFVTRQHLPTWMAASHCALFFIKPVYSKIASSPTKHGELMSMGLPVICNTGVGDMAKIVTETKSGYLVDAFNTTNYTKAINQIDNLLNIPQEYIRQQAAQVYALQNAIEKYAQLYKTVLDKAVTK